MPEPGPTPSAEALLRHADFLQALARRLLFDEGQAQDVVQEAMVFALRRAPRRPARLRAWLGGVTRTLARRSRRAEGRRRRRERAAARPEAQAAAADVAGRLELQRRVVDEVQRAPRLLDVVHE
ncbi:MAG: sigma factor, partial [Planctomycetota bacterium]